MAGYDSPRRRHVTAESARRAARLRYGKRYYIANRDYILARNGRNRRGQPDKWYASYWFKRAPLVKWRNHRRYVMERWRRIESGDLVLDERGVAMPKPTGGIFRVRAFGARW